MFRIEFASSRPTRANSVGEVADRVADECLQLHGGMGYMDETFISRVWRDQRLLRIGGGASEVMRYLIAKLMNF